MSELQEMFEGSGLCTQGNLAKGNDGLYAGQHTRRDFEIFRAGVAAARAERDEAKAKLAESKDIRNKLVLMLEEENARFADERRFQEELKAKVREATEANANNVLSLGLRMAELQAKLDRAVAVCKRVDAACRKAHTGGDIPGYHLMRSALGDWISDEDKAVVEAE